MTAAGNGKHSTTTPATNRTTPTAAPRPARDSTTALVNARMHGWLAPDLDRMADALHATRMQVNSAALWHFLNKLSARERAEVLGEYVTALAMQSATTEDNSGTLTLEK
jgi:hypothetical protein